MIQLNCYGTLPKGVTASVLKRAMNDACRLARKKTDGNVSVRFVSEPEIARLNAAYRKKRRPTDVLSFSPNEGGLVPEPKGSEKDWGDVVIASAYARREAKRRAIDVPEEIVRLAVHGMLHLLGYDHATPEDEVRMFGLQERAVENVYGDV